jgi:hypothetical protein
MKDNLEEFIRANRASFDVREPAEKGWERVASNLRFASRTSIWSSLIVWRAAAAVFFALFLYLLAPRQYFSGDSNLSLKEFNEVEAYYSNEIYRKVKLIDEISSDNQDNQFTQDLHQLDAMYQVLKEEMRSHPTKKVKDALVLNLMVRINLLNQQLESLEPEERPANKEI